MVTTKRKWQAAEPPARWAIIFIARNYFAKNQIAERIRIATKILLDKSTMRVSSERLKFEPPETMNLLLKNHFFLFGLIIK
jgi:hypothetical protein